MTLKRRLKQAAWAVLPPAVIQSIRKRHYARLVSASGPHQEPDMHVVRHLVRAGDVAIDIGANIGVYTKALSECVGAEGRVYSVEPFPSTFELLRHNVERLRLDNVELMNVALSDAEGEVVMDMPGDPSGAETHYLAHVVGDGTTAEGDRTTGIKATTVDVSFSATGTGIAFVKCDVEGHELACVRGASGFLKQHDAAWLIEISGDPDDDRSPAHRVFEILRGHGYTAWWFDGTKLTKRRRGDTSINYFFLRERHTDLLTGAGLELAT